MAASPADDAAWQNLGTPRSPDHLRQRKASKAAAAATDGDGDGDGDDPDAGDRRSRAAHDWKWAADAVTSSPMRRRQTLLAHATKMNVAAYFVRHLERRHAALAAALVAVLAAGDAWPVPESTLEHWRCPGSLCAHYCCCV